MDELSNAHILPVPCLAAARKEQSVQPPQDRHIWGSAVPQQVLHSGQHATVDNTPSSGAGDGMQRPGSLRTSNLSVMAIHFIDSASSVVTALRHGRWPSHTQNDSV